MNSPDIFAFLAPSVIEGSRLLELSLTRDIQHFALTTLQHFQHFNTLVTTLYKAVINPAFKRPGAREPSKSTQLWAGK